MPAAKRCRSRFQRIKSWGDGFFRRQDAFDFASAIGVFRGSDVNRVAAGLAQADFQHGPCTVWMYFSGSFGSWHGGGEQKECNASSLAEHDHTLQMG